MVCVQSQHRPDDEWGKIGMLLCNSLCNRTKYDISFFSFNTKFWIKMHFYFSASIFFCSAHSWQNNHSRDHLLAVVSSFILLRLQNMLLWKIRGWNWFLSKVKIYTRNTNVCSARCHHFMGGIVAKKQVQSTRRMARVSAVDKWDESALLKILKK